MCDTCIKHAASPEIDERLGLLGRHPCQQFCRMLEEIERLDGLLNTPEIVDFGKAVVLEAAHQRERWGAGHDAAKSDADWFWLIGYLAGKALHTPINKDLTDAMRAVDDPSAGRALIEKQLHRIIAIAAAAANWHAAVLKDLPR